MGNKEFGNLISKIREIKELSTKSAHQYYLDCKTRKEKRSHYSGPAEISKKLSVFGKMKNVKIIE